LNDSFAQWAAFLVVAKSCRVAVASRLLTNQCVLHQLKTPAINSSFARDDLPQHHPFAISQALMTNIT
jgi:hypothetical protein